MDRITKKRLKTRIDTLNSMTGQPMEEYAPVRLANGNLQPNAGNYHLDWAYGGVAVDQMVDGGGVRIIIDRGTNRAVWDQLGAMIEGIRIGQKAAPPVHIVAAAPNDTNGNPRRVSVQIAGDRVVGTRDHEYKGAPREYGQEALRVSVSPSDYRGLVAMTAGGAA